jgi:hypothetical protein
MIHTPTVTDEASGFSRRSTSVGPRSSAATSVDEEGKLEEAKSLYVITCPECGDVGSANELYMAELLGRLHEAAFELADVAKEEHEPRRKPSAVCVRSLSRRTRSRIAR